jgi:hypothetical protein
MDARPVDRFLDGIERLADPLDDKARHRAVHMAGELDEAAFEPALARLPRQVERIDRNAVAAEARARIEGHEAERLRARRIDDFPHVDVHAVRHQRQLVDETDIHRPERVLEQLDHLRHCVELTLTTLSMIEP